MEWDELATILKERGLRVVPEEPTAKMEYNGRAHAREHDPSTFAGIWRAMLDAAPILCELLGHGE